jgi:hypothetical protein
MGRRRTKIHTPRPGTRLEFIVQHHKAERAGDHYDIRIGKGNTLYSWAVRRLPKPGQKVAAFEQPTHNSFWGHFEGTIKQGYGKGKVRLHKQTEAIVLDSNKNKLTIMIPGKDKIPEQYTLVKPPGSKSWLLVNHTTTRKTFPIPKGKPKYKQIEFESVDFKNPQQAFAAKIDGAHAVLYLRKGKRPRLFSFRESKRGTPLEYTFKMPTEFYIAPVKKIPRNASTAVVRGEIFGYSKKTGKVIPARILGRILNSGMLKAKDLMQQEGISLKFAPFQVSRLGRKSVEDLPYKEHLPILRQIATLPATELPSIAFSEQAKKKLHQSIAKGRHRQTAEGVVIWNMERGGSPIKAKKYPEFDVYVRKVFKEKGARKLAGGIEYSLTPRGRITGKIGTGFDHKEKADMLRHPKKYIGRVAKVRAMFQFPSGALRAPSFRGWHLDKTPKTKREAL